MDSYLQLDNCKTLNVLFASTDANILMNRFNPDKIMRICQFIEDNNPFLNKRAAVCVFADCLNPSNLALDYSLN